MKRKTRGATAQSISLSASQLFGRLALVLMLFASAALMIISHTSPDAKSRITAPIADSATPVLDVLSRPGEAIVRFSGWLQSLAQLYEQNQALREANARLMQWQHVALQLEAENSALRDLLHYASDESLKFTTAKVISDRGGPFTRTVLLNAGESLGLKAGQPVINADGLVGRLIETGNHSARVLLLTDINSRIPVITEQSRERSIAAGNNTDLLSLLYLSDDTEVKPGEKLLTSGDGNTVPAGLPVGEIVSVENGVVKVRPYASWFRLEYVSVVHQQ
ncbi:MAG: rod shape-determining protein MreC [Rickettsiales bacterium]